MGSIDFTRARVDNTYLKHITLHQPYLYSEADTDYICFLNLDSCAAVAIARFNVEDSDIGVHVCFSIPSLIVYVPRCRND